MKNSPKVRRWYKRSIECSKDDISDCQKILHVDIMKEIISKGYSLDLKRTLKERIERHPFDDDSVILIANVGVVLTKKQDLEWRIEECLKRIIQIDDELEQGWDEEWQAKGYEDESAWLREMHELRAFIEQRLDALRTRRGWK